jgi:hypothetical protein
MRGFVIPALQVARILWILFLVAGVREQQKKLSTKKSTQAF